MQCLYSMSRSRLGVLVKYKGGGIFSFLYLYGAQHNASWVQCLLSIVTVSLLSQAIAGVNNNGRVELLVASCAVQGGNTCKL